jgi:predicted Rossmann fold nucleotide-binding protein DprA/Smf involved in DNA uptake
VVVEAAAVGFADHCSARREVMAVPGSPLDPHAQGWNQRSATLIQNSTDVVEAIRPLENRVRAAPDAYHPSDGMNGNNALDLVGSCSAYHRCRSTKSFACRV